MPRNPIHRARFQRARLEANLHDANARDANVRDASVRDPSVISVAGRDAAPVALQADPAPVLQVEMPAAANAVSPVPEVPPNLTGPDQPAAADDSAAPTSTLLQTPAAATPVQPGGKAAGRKAAGRTRGSAAAPLDGRDRHGRGLPNLTDLADRYGSDKGSAKHRYTELYNMLFQPFRNTPIRFLEMGLQIGGPELGHSQDRATTDLPSVRMWLEFFAKAQIWGLDVSDFGWFSHERFQFVRCDMDDRANIAAAAAGMPPMDIMIDDASHASHHQQFAFLELFPRLNDGGLYIIEDLRWQPETYERKGITRTADLFQSYVQTGVFSHSDPALAEAFNALRIDMSGCFLHQVHFVKSRRDQVLVVHKR